MNLRASATSHKREHVHCALVTPSTYFSFVRSESNAVDLGLVRSSSKLPYVLPGGGIPYSNESSTRGGRSEILAGRGYG